MGPEHFDDPTAEPRPDTEAGSTADTPDVPGAGGVWSPVPAAQDVMSFTDVAVDAASMARLQQIATRLEELAAEQDPSPQVHTEITELFDELARLTGSAE